MLEGVESRFSLGHTKGNELAGGRAVPNTTKQVSDLEVAAGAWLRPDDQAPGEEEP